MRGFRLRFTVFSTAFARLLLLWTSLVVIVGASYLVRQTVSDNIVEALRLVAHTHEVRETVFEVTSSLSEMQIAALASRLNGAADAIPARYSQAHDQYLNKLDALRKLTLGSAVQQERIGMLRARIEDRVAVFDRVIHEPAEIGQAAADLENAVTRFPVDDITGAILSHEDTLVQSRQNDADRRVIEGNWATLLATLATILLLGTVVWVSERQMRRRTAAESETRRAVERARLIVESVREPIAIITGDLNLLQANRAFGDFYGTAESMHGLLTDIPGWSLIPPTPSHC